MNELEFRHGTFDYEAMLKHVEAGHECARKCQPERVVDGTNEIADIGGFKGGFYLLFTIRQECYAAEPYESDKKAKDWYIVA